jgi:amino acid adenylation domain-containing protein
LTAYNRVFLYRLTGPLDWLALEKSVNAVILRQESLRANFPAIAGRPLQRLTPFTWHSLETMDLTSLSKESRISAAIQQAELESARPFSLDHEPLCRVRLLRLGVDDHALLLNIHHIVFDAWSHEIFMNELAEYYRSFNLGIPAGMPDLPQRYVDFISWQRDWLSGENLERQLTYWRDKLDGDLPVLNLPADRPRPSRQTYRGTSVRLLFPREKSGALKTMFRRQHVTAAAGLLAAFAVLLFRYTGETDLIMGCPFANRTRTDVENLIGLFVNILPLRIDLSGDPNFHELLGRVRQTLLEAASYQALPFEQLLSELGFPRDPSRNPVYQVLFNMRNVPPRPHPMGMLSIEPIEFVSGASTLDLDLEVSETEEGFQLQLNYNVDLFNNDTIRRMLGHLQVLLNGILSDPETPISCLPLLTEAERRQLLFEWNDTQVPFPEQLGLHQVFDQQAAAHPQAIAVSMGQSRLTYAELKRRTDEFAAYLVQAGTAPNDVIAIAMERTPDMMIAILGILKAGAAYLVLELSFPRERLALTLADSQAKTILADRASTPKVNGLESVRVLPWPVPGSPQAPLPERPVGQIACVFFTSGSTGRPKGVAITHRGIARYLSGIAPFLYTATDVRAQISAPSSDFFTHELWGTLLNGARLEIVPQSIAYSPDALLQYIRATGITSAFVPTGFVNLIVREKPDAFADLRELSFGGEAADPEIVRQILRHGKPDLLINGYGPTETTTLATAYVIEQADEDQINLPIGRPLANTTIYIVDDHLSPVPIGVPGELLIGGPGVSPGYLNLPEQTAEAFIPVPFGGEFSGRLFRTGDRARYLPDGNIEFLGREDSQLKLHGYRVEPGEIEAVLQKHPSIRQAVVVAQTIRGTKQLAAFYVPAGQIPSPIELQDFLKSKLPYYMLPAAYCALGSFPLTASGKVDRLTLSQHQVPSTDSGEVSPRDSIEARLMEIWERLLGVDHVGLTDNFFELGGHSLLAARMVSEIEREFDCLLPLGALFEDGTVAAVARLIRKRPSSSSMPQLVPLQTHGEKQPLFLAPGGMGEVFYLRDLVQELGTDRPIYGLQSLPPSFFSKSLTAISSLAQRYLREIRELQPEGPYLFLGHSTGGLLVFEMACQLLEAGEQVGWVGLLDSYFPGVRPTASAAERMQIHWRNIREANGVKDLSRYLQRRTRKLIVRLIHKPSLFGLAIRLRLLPTDRKTLAAMIENTFQPAFFGGCLTIFRVTDRPWYERTDQLAAWKNVAREVLYVNVTGNHATLLSPPHVRELARQIRTQLERCEAPGAKDPC